MVYSIERNFKILKQIKINNFSCQNCKTKTNLILTVNSGYVSVFFIPMLPIKKDYILNCQGCNKIINKNSLDYIENEKVENEFSSTKYIIPIKHFTGFILLLLIISFAIYTGFKVKKEEQYFISNPKIEDVYFVKNKFGWTTFKVCKVIKDSVYVLQNKIVLDNYDRINEIEKHENYISECGFKKVELERMFETNMIYEVKR